MDQFSINNFRSEWISSEGEFNDDTIRFAEEFGKRLCALGPNNRPGNDALTTSQIRNYFGEVKGIQAKIRKEDFNKHKVSFLLLKPKLAYAEARAKSKGRGGSTMLSHFRAIMDKAHDAVLSSKSNQKESFQRFVDFLEAVLAYHKVYGGKD